MENVLVVEADPQTLRARGDELLLDGLEVYTASTRHHALTRLEYETIDAVVLGSLNERAESLALLRELRSGTVLRVDPQLPVVAVGADTDHTALRYYQAGADIALHSTASPLLIKGALDALVSRLELHQHHRLLRVGHLAVDCDARIATVNGSPLTLTRLEFDLLQTLARHPHRTFHKAELTREIWGYEPGTAGVSRTVDSHAARLRNKIRSAGPDEFVQTVRGVGYRLTR
jgi:DNA-binding response OmpR family regulator